MPAETPLIPVDEHLKRILDSIDPCRRTTSRCSRRWASRSPRTSWRRCRCRPSTTPAMDGYAVVHRDVAEASEQRPGAPAGGRGDRGRASDDHGDVARHRGPDHDRRPGPAGLRRGRARSSGPTAAPRRCVIDAGARGRPAHPAARARTSTTGDRWSARATVIGPRQIGLLAAVGTRRVASRPRPRVVVISTG